MHAVFDLVTTRASISPFSRSSPLQRHAIVHHVLRDSDIPMVAWKLKLRLYVAAWIVRFMFVHYLNQQQLQGYAPASDISSCNSNGNRQTGSTQPLLQSGCHFPLGSALHEHELQRELREKEGMGGAEV
jgi:hypothetical protein